MPVIPDGRNRGFFASGGGNTAAGNFPGATVAYSGEFRGVAPPETVRGRRGTKAGTCVR
jgi:hypothetical protein